MDNKKIWKLEKIKEGVYTKRIDYLINTLNKDHDFFLFMRDLIILGDTIINNSQYSAVMLRLESKMKYYNFKVKKDPKRKEGIIISFSPKTENEIIAEKV